MLSVREITENDIVPLTGYWLEATDIFLTGMGVDLSKMPSRKELTGMLSHQISVPYEHKQSYCIIWLKDNLPVGHCNINKIIFGEEASMHLHIWNEYNRHKGMGAEFIKISVPYFFENLRLKKIYSEPYSLNPAPHKTLAKAGFTFVKEYITIPGWINFEQSVKQWQLVIHEV